MDGHLRPLLIGQAPPPNYDPRTHSPLYPLPEAASGGRLADIMGLDHRTYLRTFQRINLLRDFPSKREHPGGTRRDHWPRAEARYAAELIAPLLHGRRVVLVGRNVARAFGLEKATWHTWQPHRVHYPPDDPAQAEMAVVPHPSGLCRWYNDPANMDEARVFWSALLKGDTP